jgi:hypothetical protein
VNEERDLEKDELEVGPVERRAAVRGVVKGMTVTVLDGVGAKGQLLAVRDCGLDSIFVEGPKTSELAIGDTYRVRLQAGEQTLEFAAECVRKESKPRVGAVLRPPAEEKAARAFLEQLLDPARVPPGAD